MRHPRKRHGQRDPQQSGDWCTERFAAWHATHQFDNRERHPRGGGQYDDERLECCRNREQQSERCHPGCGAAPRAVAWRPSSRSAHQAAGEQHHHRSSSIGQQHIPAASRQRVVRQRAHGVQHESDQPAIAARPVSARSRGAQPPHAHGAREHQAPYGDVSQQSDGTEQHGAAETQQSHRRRADPRGTDPAVTPAIRVRPEHGADIGEMCELAECPDAASEQVA